MPNDAKAKKQGGLLGQLVRALGGQSTGDEKQPDAPPRFAAEAGSKPPWRTTPSGLVIATPENLEALLSLAQPPARIWWEKAEMELCLVPAGEFLMGSDGGEAGEKPQHPITLDAYYIGRCPVTQAQYARFVQAAGHRVPFVDADWAKAYNWDAARKAPPRGKEQHPVVLVSWDDAVAYCWWAGLRLPAEAEWEKAARGTDGRIYPWGNKWDAARCNTHEGGKGGTTPVGAYSPGGDSPYGCADMAGNVWEWCADWYDGGYYAHSPSRNPQGPSSGSYKVLRGGSWGGGWDYVRVALRYDLTPDDRYGSFGFRCAASPGG
jgi:sulfatase modifying factor 1